MTEFFQLNDKNTQKNTKGRHKICVSMYFSYIFFQAGEVAEDSQLIYQYFYCIGTVFFIMFR